MKSWILAFTCVTATAFAQPTDERLTTVRTLDTPHRFEPPDTLAAWQARAKQLRTRVEVAAGLFPMKPRDVPTIRVTTTLPRDGYTVANVWFESRPGWIVTGNLYRPTEPLAENERRPAVLSPHGHWEKGRWFERSEADANAEIESGAEQTLEGARFPLQARCAHLARMGFVVLHYDMVGYADDAQVAHGDGFPDIESELYGLSAFGLQTYNSLRALDALAGLSDVDASRIGVTGASGGGTQTFILCAIDDRPRAAFPAVMVSNRMQGGCICENASLLRLDTDNVEIAALTAPRPLGLTGADDWTKHIETEGYPELKRVFGLFGAESNVEAHCHPEFPHNYNQVAREHMYAFFARHLAPKHAELVRELPFVPVPPRELRVFDDAHPRPKDLLTIGALRELLREEARAEIAARVPNDADSLARFRDVVGRALEVMVAPWPSGVAGPDAMEIELVTEAMDIGASVVRTVRLTEPAMKVAVDALVVLPKQGRRGAVVVVAPGGAQALLDDRDLKLVERAEKAGVALVLPDLIAMTGKIQRLPIDVERHERYVGYTTTYNRTLLAERVRDLLVTIRYARTLSEGGQVDIAGLARSGIAVTLASALSPDRPRRTLAHAEFDFSWIRNAMDPDFLPSALRFGSLDAFGGLIAPRAQIRVGATEIGPSAVACYRVAGAEDQLRDLPSDRLLTALDALFRP